MSGGRDNQASGTYAVVGGGSANSATGEYAVVSGGLSNTASGVQAMVGGGAHNVVTGASSFAVGRNATVPHANAAVLSFATEGSALLECGSPQNSSVNVCVGDGTGVGGFFVNGRAVLRHLDGNLSGALEVRTRRTRTR